MKNKDIEFLLNIAKLAAEESHAIRLKVGGVVVDFKDNIVAYGYNGTVKGMSNECEDKIYSSNVVTSVEEYPFKEIKGSYIRHYKLVTKESTLHAEQNIITHAARRGISIDGGTMFLTHSPCAKCTALMIQSGIKQVYFIDKFRTYDEVYKEFSNHIGLIQYEIF